MKKISILFLLFTIHLFCYAQGGIWTWVKGSSLANDTGNIGTKGVTNAANYPGSRYQAVQWTDAHGKFWVFGGVNASGERNDLWEYDPVTNNWTWINGPHSPNGAGIYGTRGIPGLGNIPGARAWGIRSWTDDQGHLWLNGGFGYDHSGSLGTMDDMWMYNIATNEWTWMAGSDTVNPLPRYGALQLAASGNTPGGRQECNTAWLKSDGTLWTFGGQGVSGYDYYNDVWKFDIGTNMWTWMSGPSDTNSLQNYGALNVESSANLPHARMTYTHWTDASDDFYIFSGQSASAINYNDVWRYNSTNNRWTWIGGDSTASSGLYLGMCSPGGGKRPRGRWENRSAQTTGCTNVFWTFGGTGNNDLWNFNIRTNQWTWVSGDSVGSHNGNYGTIGVSSASNFPPDKDGGCMWADGNGVLWIWGGTGFAASQRDDMWKFVPDSSCYHPSLFTAPILSSLSDSIICQGDSSTYTLLNGHYLSIHPAVNVNVNDSSHLSFHPDTTTTYQLTAVSACGNLSTLIFTIVVLPSSGTSLSQAICSGSTFSFHGHMLSSAGVYADTLSNTRGCDSIVTLHLSITPLEHDSIAQTICEGDSFVLGGLAHYSSGYYSQTYTGVNGCDSTITVHLSVDPLPVVSWTQTNTLCHRATLLTGGSPSGGYYSGPFVVGDSIIAAPADTTFAVSYIYTDRNGCIASVSLQFHSTKCTGIPDVDGASEIHLYPNPNSGSFILDATPAIGGLYTIYDILGQLIQQDVISRERMPVELTNNADGIYTLEVNAPASHVVLKFTVMR